MMNDHGQVMDWLSVAIVRDGPLWSLAQAAGVAWWRAAAAMVFVLAAVVLAVGAGGFAQRWVVARRRWELAAVAVFSVAAMMAAMLWMAAWLMGMVTSPGLAYDTFRPFIQGVAHCGMIGIGVSVVLLPAMALLDRWHRTGSEQAMRAAGRLALHALIVVLLGAILYEPFLLNVASARPEQDDFRIRLPLGPLFAGLMFLMIACAAMWLCVMLTHRAEMENNRDDGGDDRTHGRWPWLTAVMLLPLSYGCYRLALWFGGLGSEGAKGGITGVAGLGGPAGQGELLHLLRWCVVYGLAVVAGGLLGSRLMRLMVMTREPLRPLAMDFRWLSDWLGQLPWPGGGKVGRKAVGSGQSAGGSRQPAGGGERAAVGDSPRRIERVQKTVERESQAVARAPQAVESEREPRLVEGKAAGHVPSLPVTLHAEQTGPLTSRTDDGWEALPIDPKTGMIREDVAQRVRQELERDAGLVARPHRRHRGDAGHASSSPPAAMATHGSSSSPASASASSIVSASPVASLAASPAVSSSPPAAPPSRAHVPRHVAPYAPPDSHPSEPPANWRWFLLVLLLLYAGMAYYASMVPLNYRAISWAQAWEQLMSMERFNVADDKNRRADFVANIALFVPIGFLGMAVLALGRRSAMVATVSALAVAVVSSLLAWFIEFRQLWYPPRTVSQNDLVAEHLGALIGIVLWLLAGHGVMSRLAQMRSLSGTATARKRLLQFYAVGLFLFCLLPMDFTLSPERILDRIRSISFGGELFTGGLMSAGRVLRDVAAFLAVGMLAALHADRLPILLGPGENRRTPAAAALFVLIYAAAIEFIKLFMVNGVVDLMNLPVRTLGGWLGAHLAMRALDHNAALAVGMKWPRARRWLVALIIGAAHAALVVALLAPPWRVNWDAGLLLRRLGSMTDGLFINYYYAGEWTALTNLTHYALLFVPLGLLLRWAMHPRTVDDDSPIAADARRGGGWFAWLVPISAGLLLGGVIEVMQGGLERKIVHVTAEQVAHTTVTFTHQAVDVSNPDLSKGKHLETGPMPDTTDLLAYTAGACMGWLFMGLFLPLRPRGTRPSHLPKSPITIH